MIPMFLNATKIGVLRGSGGAVSSFHGELRFPNSNRLIA
jgi:hypothetical protein